jgi:hypothetical protein
MKKVTKLSIAVLLASCIILSSVSAVFADASINPSPDLQDPTATGNASFTSTVLGQWQLPGSEMNSKEMYLPTGFDGQAQFGGKGIEIDGLTQANTVDVCFSFPTYKYSWTGKIYEWKDTQWVSKSTNIYTTSYNGATHACTANVGNGIYSFVIWYTGSSN